MNRKPLSIAFRVSLSLTLFTVFSITAAAQASHNVWSSRPLYLRDAATGVTFDTFVSGDASFAWTQGTLRAYAHAVGKPTAVLTYDFMLISVTSTNNSGINGRWNVRRNGVLVCSNCIGKAYLLDQPIGQYFKIYIGTPLAYGEKWHYSGYITNRYDY